MRKQREEDYLSGNLTAMIFGYKPKPNFTVENEAVISKPPTVDFAPASAAH